MKNIKTLELVLQVLKNLSEIWKNRRKKIKNDNRKHYKSLKEISIKNWWEVMEGKLENLIIEGNYTNVELVAIYEMLMQEYLDNFGTTEDYKLFLTRKLDYALALSEYVEEQSDHKKMLLEMAKIDFQEFMKVANRKDEKPQSLESLMMLVEKKMGFQINENIMSAFKFYTYLKSE